MSTVSPTSSSTISLTALGTGIDWQSIVSQLTSVSEQELTPYNDQISAYNTQISAWGTISSDLGSLQTASNTLASPTGLSLYTTSVSSNSSTSASSLLTATASSSANVGTYSVVINSVAQSQQMASTDFSSQTNALNLTGSFTVNGQTVSLAASDTLQTLQTKINALDSGSTPSGVTASIIQDSASTYRMVLSSDTTGAAGMTLADATGSTALESLGFNTSGVTGGTANTTNGTTPITSASLISGIAGYSWKSGDTISISGTNHSGTSVSGNFTIGQNSTVQDLLNQINSVFGNVAATVTSSGQIQVADSATGASQLSVSLTPSNASLGFGSFTTGPVQDVIQQGTNASFSVDGMNISSASNTAANVLSGVTLNLLAASPGTTLTLNVGHDTSGIETEVNSMISAYNQVISDINTQNTYNSTTNTTGGPLFGDPTLQGLKSQLADTALSQIGTGTYNTLTSIGITIGANGTLSMDKSTFEQAMATNFQAVTQIFQDSGTTDNSLFQYGGNTSSTLSGTYAVSFSSASGGTIDGQAASGSGNILSLTGSTSGANGLTVSYSGSTYPAGANVTVNRGVASLLSSLVNAYTNATTGIITTQDNGINNSISGLQTQITNMQANIDQQTASLTQEYENMNTTVAQLDQMQSYLNTQLSSLSS
ncbi:MAG: flagellar filament capping protein FliD [Syntrophobacteraceae bacterium]